ncbi:RNA polymerase factor sigma-54 [uncultured Cloacibacillus sp.]|uniref:RNA polymerase factor sigma-54 n=1 Tax=uncultured Cloacibacillus sp. TaxID=889794 RepID=UPI0026286AF9|nr:RNA polymerase factor sigma-54 [uncultured Cloacibacillus sp.]
MLKLEQKQTQTLSNKMIESLQVLQMSRGELAERLEELYAENPLLELDERGEAAPQPPEAESLKKLEWLARFDEQNAAYMRQEADDDEDGWLENIAAPQEETLEDSLMEQLAGRGFGDGEMKIFRYIAESLDERGYFTERAGELASRFGIETREAERLLGVMKRLDPPGICAGSLAECLALQLERAGGCEIEKEIVTHHLEALAKRQLKTIARELKIPVSRVLDALAKIQTLNPKPANGFTDGEPAAYVSPDVTVTVRAGDCRAELNFDAGASLSISRGYLELARRGDCPDEVRRYIAGKAREIEQISTNIKRRNDTLTELAACIAEEQRDFFVRGRTALRPLRMKTVAEKLGLHESTISRAVSGKYLQCRWGVFSLGYFFTKGYSLEGGGAEIATQQVKEKLRAVIAREDRDKPYSDQKLSEILSVMGIEISRRTVAKYRDELGIADCRARKFTPLS